MAFVYITGISGSGKSTVRGELFRRGYEAHDTDEDGIARFVNKATGAITLRASATDRTQEFTTQNDWKADPERVRQLADRADDHLVFLCGAVTNEVEIWNLFSRVILLSIDEATMRHRVATRTTNDFGKNPHELELMLGWHKGLEDDYRGYGAVIVDATRTVADLVDEVLAIAQLAEGGHNA